MKKLVLFTLILISSLSFLEGVEVNAQGGNSFEDNNIFPNWKEGEKPIGVIGVNGGGLDSLNERDTPTQGLVMFFPTIINYTLYTIAAVVIVVLIYSGIKLLIAQGSDENHEKSKSVFQYAIIGFLFAISAYTIVRVAYEILIDRAA